MRHFPLKDTPQQVNCCGVLHYRKTPRGDLAALFVIDGRDYQGVDEMKKAIMEATIWTYQLDLVYETEAHLIRNPKAPRLHLPSWYDFKKQLPDE